MFMSAAPNTLLDAILQLGTQPCVWPLNKTYTTTFPMFSDAFMHTHEAFSHPFQCYFGFPEVKMPVCTPLCTILNHVCEFSIGPMSSCPTVGIMFVLACNNGLHDYDLLRGIPEQTQSHTFCHPRWVFMQKPVHPSFGWVKTVVDR